MGSINKKDLGITEDDITFVLTIPAIWNEPAKQFMREAAVDVSSGVLTTCVDKFNN